MRWGGNYTRARHAPPLRIIRAPPAHQERPHPRTACAQNRHSYSTMKEPSLKSKGVYMPSEDRRVVSKQLPATSKNSALVTDGWKPSERAMVAAALGKVFDIQKAFGKTAGQLHTIIEAFCWGLRKYRADRVVWALGEYMLRKPDMPTPYDIRQIIDPIPEPPKFDKAYYVRL